MAATLDNPIGSGNGQEQVADGNAETFFAIVKANNGLVGRKLLFKLFNIHV